MLIPFFSLWRSFWKSPCSPLYRSLTVVRNFQRRYSKHKRIAFREHQKFHYFDSIIAWSLTYRYNEFRRGRRRKSDIDLDVATSTDGERAGQTKARMAGVWDRPVFIRDGYHSYQSDGTLSSINRHINTKYSVGCHVAAWADDFRHCTTSFGQCDPM